MKIKKHKWFNDPLLLRLIAASTIASEQIPTFTLGSMLLHWHLNKYADRNGFLQTQKLTGTNLDLLRQMLVQEPCSLLTNDDCTTLIFDLGATITTTYNEANFKPGMLEYFKDGEVKPVQGIEEALQIKGHSTMSFQVIDNECELVDIKTAMYYISELQLKLFSPQAYFQECNNDSEFILK